MTEKEIREAVKHKENYSSIVIYFKMKEILSGADLALLIDIIEEMSPEIYEHYRALQDIFREGIRKHLEDSLKISDELFTYAVKKGCDMGTLLMEKYADYI